MNPKPSKMAVFTALMFVFIFVFAMAVPRVLAKNYSTVIDEDGIAVSSPASFLPKPVVNGSEAKETVFQARMLEYKVTKGDNLTKIEKRFGVKKSGLLSAVLNPKLAERNNPDLIFVGEKIKIPLYGIVPISSPGTAALPSLSDEMVMMTKAEYARMESNQARIAELTKSLEYEESRNGPELLSIIIAMLIALTFLILWMIENAKNTNLREESANKETKSAASLENSSPEEILALLRTVRWQELIMVNDMTLACDENGSPMTLKKAKEIVEKRSYLRSLTVNQSEEAMKTAKMNTRPAEINTSEHRMERMRSAETGD